MIKNLKYLRNRKSISQQQLAEIIGVSQQSINKYENHGVEPDIATLIKIADYFETSVDFLIGHTGIDHKIERVEPFDLNDEEINALRLYRSLNNKQRQCALTLMESYLE